LGGVEGLDGEVGVPADAWREAVIDDLLADGQGVIRWKVELAVAEMKDVDALSHEALHFPDHLARWTQARPGRCAPWERVEGEPHDRFALRFANELGWYRCHRTIPPRRPAWLPPLT